MYDIIVIGAGPAGLTAAIYGRRAEKSVLILEKTTFGGQITHSPLVENYPGFASASGNEIAEKMLEQALSQGAEVELDMAVSITGELGNFTVQGENGAYMGKTVILATGSRHRLLGLPKEMELTGEGVSYCAVCDGAFYKGKTVAVIGGGNSALQEAILLSSGCKKVYIVQNLAFLTGEERLINELKTRENVEIILSTVVTELVGDTALNGIMLRNEDTGKETALLLDGIFVAIGQTSDNESFKEIVALNESGYIISGEDCIPESRKGIFVAGDCRTKSIRQITTATADGAVAALAACRILG
ncbi:MAG: FAD-dependent oxidoreductase [Clostridia bacterium]|nr:FAD-dependent oxidoreductase [Clostridia bacterium]